MNATAALWFTVIGLGLYHGLNPGMGWPLAVANGLTERRAGAVFRTVLKFEHRVCHVLEIHS